MSTKMLPKKELLLKKTATELMKSFEKMAVIFHDSELIELSNKIEYQILHFHETLEPCDFTHLKMLLTMFDTRLYVVLADKAEQVQSMSKMLQMSGIPGAGGGDPEKRTEIQGFRAHG